MRAANKGPLPDIELTHIYERIIDVMRALQRNEVGIGEECPLKGQGTGAGPVLALAPEETGTGNDRCGVQEKATEEQIDFVIDAMVENGVGVHRTTGATALSSAGVGPTASIDLLRV